MKETRLFDDIQRTHHGIIDLHEHYFPYLNRSARSKANQARKLCEEWFDCYKQDASESEINEFRKRFRDDRYEQHYSAWFELLVHQVLVRLGASIRIHPELPGTPDRPDFMADMDKPCVIVEATVVAPDDDQLTSYERDAIDKIRELKSDVFELIIESIQGTLERYIPKNQILPQLKKLLNGHNPDHVQAMIDRGGNQAAPRTTVRVDNWSITVRLWPVKPQHRGPRKSIVSGPPVSVCGDSVQNVQKKLKSKVRKYGQIQDPFIIALNVHSHISFDHIDAKNALFGRQGVWGTSASPHYRELSGVLLVTDTNSYCVPSTQACLYINPFAPSDIISRIPKSLYRFPHVTDGDNLIQGESVPSLLGLP